MHYLSACLIVRDELDLEEYIAYHRVVGLEHFYIYDNESQVPVKETLRKYIDKGLVDVIVFPGRAKQMEAYDHFLANFGKETKWSLIADSDELLVPVKKDAIPEVLQEYEDVNLSVNWLLFGSSGHINRPNALMMESYTSTIPRNHYENTHCKALIQPDKALKAFSNPHYMVPKPGVKNIHPDTRAEVRGAWSKHSCLSLQLNHFVLKSREDFEKKIAKPRADTQKYSGKTMKDFKLFDNLATEKDETILRFVDKTKKLLGE